jgi:hypothetical protein
MKTTNNKIKVWVRRYVDTKKIAYVTSSRAEARKIAKRFGLGRTTKPEQISVNVN